MQYLAKGGSLAPCEPALDPPLSNEYSTCTYIHVCVKTCTMTVADTIMYIIIQVTCSVSHPR